MLDIFILIELQNMHLHKHGRSQESPYGLGKIIANASWDEARSQKKCRGTHRKINIKKYFWDFQSITLRAPDKLKFFCRNHIS